MDDRENLKMSPQLFLAAVLRRKLLFLIVVLLCTAAAGYMALKTTFSYESSAQILVKPGAREGFSVESATLRGTPIVDRHAYTEFANTLAILQSRDLLDRLVDKVQESKENIDLGPVTKTQGVLEKKEWSFLKEWVDKLLMPPEYQAVKNNEDQRRELLRLILAQAIVVEQIPGTTVVEITAAWKDPRVAYVITNLMLEVFRDHYREFFRDRDSIKFIADLVKESEKKLQAFIQKEEDLRVEYKIADVGAEITQVLHQIGQLQESYTECQVMAASASGRSGYLDDMLKKMKPSLRTQTNTTINPEWSAISLRLQELQRLRASTPRSQRAAIDKEIKDLNDKLQKEPMVVQSGGTATPNPLFTRLQEIKMTWEADSAGTSNKCTTIASEIQALRLRHDTLRRVDKILQGIKLERRLVEEELRSHRRSLQAAKTADQLAQGHITSLKVIERPELNPNPVRNRKPLVLAGGALFGILAGIGLCSLLYRRVREISSSGQLKEVAGHKVIGAVPACRYTTLLKKNNQKQHWS